MAPTHNLISGGPRHVLILGSTGSIGCQALDVLAAMPQATVVGLCAGSSSEPLRAQALATGVRQVCLRDQAAAAQLACREPSLHVHAGDAGLHELIGGAAAAAAAEGVPLVVLNGIVGAAGLRATIAALQHGAVLALANKESMVAGGPFVLAAARRSGALIVPVDSEHSALFQCLSAGGTAADGDGVEELLLTGSGGPFRGRKTGELADVTAAQALAHPTWAMGPKISIDSATLMNKGLEVIEAHRLFGVPYKRITVLLNPQSIVHSMVRFTDGAILAHLGVPDMRTPIGYALAYPERPPLAMVRRLDLFAAQRSFERPDPETFRCLALAEEAGRRAAAAEAQPRSPRSPEEAAVGASPPAEIHTIGAPIVLNAANEVAVAAFLRGAVPFLAIAEIVERCLTWLGDEPIASLDDVYACDAEARRFAHEAAASPA